MIRKKHALFAIWNLLLIKCIISNKRLGAGHEGDIDH